MNNCLNCNSETTNPSFCSLSCSASYNNSLSPKRKRKPVICNCIICHKDFTANRHKAKVCSRECQDQYKREKNDNKILQNGGFLSNAYNKTIRHFLIRQHGNNCMICGMDANNWQGRQLTLIVDHIDGKANNNSLDNLRIVCPNCDSQLPTYKAKNKGNSSRSYYIVQK
jgi:hypothetical protein